MFGPEGYFLSMVKLKLATAIEMMTIAFPEYFLAMGSAANSIKVSRWRSQSYNHLKFPRDWTQGSVLHPIYMKKLKSVSRDHSFHHQGLAFMASGSTRSVFNLTFAKDNNIADITAKATSQWIFSSLIGTAAGGRVIKG